MESLLLLLGLCLCSRAYSPSNYNLTVTFSPDSLETCDTEHNATKGITFTTDSPVYANACWDLDQLLGGNSSYGFRNLSTLVSSAYPNYGISWQLLNKQSYDPNANYSQFWYYQQSADTGQQPGSPGQAASRVVEFYDSTGCESKTLKKPLWIGQSCQSSDQGECHRAPWQIKSFSIQPERDLSRNPCWDFSYEGVGTRSIATPTLTAAFVGVLIIIGAMFSL